MTAFISLVQQTFIHLFQNMWVGFSFAEFAIPIGFLLWLPLISMRLKGVDCADMASALFYIGYTTFAGLVLVVVIPSLYVHLNTFGEVSPLTAAFIVLSAIRWLRAYDVQKKALIKEGKRGPSL